MRYTLRRHNGLKPATSPSSKGSERKHGFSFFPVFDSRKHNVPRFWRRGSRYYAQWRVDRGNKARAATPLRLGLFQSGQSEGRTGP